VRRRERERRKAEEGEGRRGRRSTVPSRERTNEGTRGEK
jgi:hypothetical protein